MSDFQTRGGGSLVSVVIPIYNVEGRRRTASLRSSA